MENDRWSLAIAAAKTSESKWTNFTISNRKSHVCANLVATHTLDYSNKNTWNVSIENDRWSLAIAAAKTSESKWR